MERECDKRLAALQSGLSCYCLQCNVSLAGSNPKSPNRGVKKRRLWSDMMLEARGKDGDNLLYKFVCLCQNCYEMLTDEDSYKLFAVAVLENPIRFCMDYLFVLAL